MIGTFALMPASMMYAAFCADPLNPRKVEPDYELEALCARDAGFNVIVIDHDELDQRIDPKAALKPARISDSGSFVYRGWMLRSSAYTQLHDALLDSQLQPLVSAKNYEVCHHAPNSIETLKAFIPQTKFVSINDLDNQYEIRETLSSFSEGGVVIKDWVKSQASGYWHEACYIPDVQDAAAAEKVINRFRELQADSLVGGIVFKKYVPLMPVGSPAYEYRAFVVEGSVVGCWPRSAEANQIGNPPQELLDQIAQCIESPFASMDLSIDENGKWWLLEVGDGQVSGLPATEAASELFEALAGAMSK
ncbi:MAG: ATP-grasp domain-containing protein [Henriciella sp.]